MKLLELIFEEKIGEPNQGTTRFQKGDNLNICLNFLKSKGIQFENIGAEDILEGNEMLILGLFWTIMRGFIEKTDSNFKFHIVETNENDELLKWCKMKTYSYKNVKIEDFSNSWNSGLGFNALIHAYFPELINYDNLNPENPIENLNNAFTVAFENFLIPKILDAEDVVVSTPDEKSIIAYLSLYHKYFTKRKKTLSKRIKILPKKIEIVKKTEKSSESTPTTPITPEINRTEFVNSSCNFCQFKKMEFKGIVHNATIYLEILVSETKEHDCLYKPKRPRFLAMVSKGNLF
uniref:Calponin-homology (CH) domain-containing protein n=1 Tax=Panagrolaimus sp. JU765 TaxID=591449 RepID=A0AC34QXZ2_9BILA